MKGNNVKQKTDNYCRHTETGEYVFFAGANAPAFSNPERWAFFRVPAGVHPDTFRGQLVGVHPGDAKPASVADASAQA